MLFHKPGNTQCIHHPQLRNDLGGRDLDLDLDGQGTNCTVCCSQSGLDVIFFNGCL